MTSQSELRSWLTSYIADLLGTEPDCIDESADLGLLGMDSAASVVLAGELNSLLGVDVAPDLPQQYRTIAELSRHLAEVARNPTPAGEARAA